MKLFILALVLAVSGCCVPNQAFVSYVDKTWNETIGPEYTAYIEADPNISVDTKITRRRTAKDFSQTIEAAKLGQAVQP